MTTDCACKRYGSAAPKGCVMIASKPRCITAKCDQRCSAMLILECKQPLPAPLVRNTTLLCATPSRSAIYRQRFIHCCRPCMQQQHAVAGSTLSIAPDTMVPGQLRLDLTPGLPRVVFCALQLATLIVLERLHDLLLRVPACKRCNRVRQFAATSS